MPAKELDVKCPGCDGPMERDLLASAEVLRCNACGGIWLDALQAERIRGRRLKALTDSPGDGQARRPAGVQCRQCGVPLVPLVDPDHPRDRYDSCADCLGLFARADRREPSAVQQFQDRLRGWLATEGG